VEATAVLINDVKGSQLWLLAVILDSTLSWGFVSYFLLQRSSMRRGEKRRGESWAGVVTHYCIINLLYKRMPRAPTIATSSTNLHHG
jgi:hypothetical protein